MTISARWALSALIVSFVLSGCAGTRVVGQWRDETFQPQPFQKILVAAIAYNPIHQNLFEESVREVLQARGFAAQTSVHALPPKLWEMPRDGLRQLVVENGFDSAIVLSLASVDYKKGGDKPLYGVPALASRSFDAYYPLIYENVQKSGAFSPDKKAVFEANFFAIDHKGMVWRLLMQTTDIDPVTELAERLAHNVVKRLLTDKILLPVSAPN